jgi:diacylglycerol kinase family enzyme
VRVYADTPLAVEIDGELGAHTPLDIEVHPRALRLLL